MERIMLDRLVEVFCEVDDFCKAFQDVFESHLIGNGRGSRGPDPGLADAEIITLLLVLHSSGFKYLKNFYNSPMGEALRRYFPGMPCYERFIAVQQRAFLPWWRFCFRSWGRKRVSTTSIPPLFRCVTIAGLGSTKPLLS